MTEIVRHKNPDGSITHYDKYTNDPIAVTYKTKNDSYLTKWHPYINNIFPETTHFFNRIDDRTFETQPDVKRYVDAAYSKLLNSGFKTMDKYNVKYMGILEKNDYFYNKHSHYEVHDDTSHIADLYVPLDRNNNEDLISISKLHEKKTGKVHIGNVNTLINQTLGN